MSIHQLNVIGRRDGLEAAIRYAEVAQLPRNIRRPLKDGEWSFDGKPYQNRGEEIHLGSKGDVSLHAVKVDGKIVRIVKSIRGESGELVSAEPLDTIIIAEAMKVIL